MATQGDASSNDLLQNRRTKINNAVDLLKNKNDLSKSEKKQLKNLQKLQDSTNDKVLNVEEGEWQKYFPNNADDSNPGTNDIDMGSGAEQEQSSESEQVDDKEVDSEEEADSEEHDGSEEEDGSDEEDGSEEEDVSDAESDVPMPELQPRARRTGNGSRQRSKATNHQHNGADDEDALPGFGASLMEDCETVGRTKNEKFINGHGPPGARFYTIDNQPDANCDIDKLVVINEYMKPLGSHKTSSGKPLYTRRHVAAVYGIAFKELIKKGLYGPECIDPDKKPKDGNYPLTYVLIGWRTDLKKPKNITRTWETRTTCRRLWGDDTDAMLFKGASEAYLRCLKNGGRPMSRSVTPGLISDLIQQQRQASYDAEGRGYSYSPSADVPQQSVEDVRARSQRPDPVPAINDSQAQELVNGLKAIALMFKTFLPNNQAVNALLR